MDTMASPACLQWALDSGLGVRDSGMYVSTVLR